MNEKGGLTMTNEQRVEMYRMRLEGASLQEIADKFGVTRQAVHQAIPAVEPRPCYRAKCIYPNLQNWLIANERSLATFSEITGVNKTTLYKVLGGQGDPCKKTIDAILRTTGMDYETAFAPKEDT